MTMEQFYAIACLHRYEIMKWTELVARQAARAIEAGDGSNDGQLRDAAQILAREIEAHVQGTGDALARGVPMAFLNALDQVQAEAYNAETAAGREHRGINPEHAEELAFERYAAGAQ